MTPDEIYQFININPGKGRPSVFWGTNITPEHIWEDLGKGLTFDQILSHHPQLTSDHLEAALLYREVFPTDEERLAVIALGIFGRLSSN